MEWPLSSRRPRFRFTPAEVAEMEEHLRRLNNAIPHRNVVQYLAEKFTASSARSGKTPVEYKQVGFPSYFLPGDTSVSFRSVYLDSWVGTYRCGPGSRTASTRSSTGHSRLPLLPTQVLLEYSLFHTCPYIIPLIYTFLVQNLCWV